MFGVTAYRKKAKITKDLSYMQQFLRVDVNMQVTTVSAPGGDAVPKSTLIMLGDSEKKSLRINNVKNLY
jgi:hypothetical protein